MPSQGAQEAIQKPPGPGGSFSLGLDGERLLLPPQRQRALDGAGLVIFLRQLALSTPPSFPLNFDHYTHANDAHNYSQPYDRSA